MSSTKNKTEPVQVIAGYSTDEQLFAARYKQGGRTVYSVALTPAEIINNIPRPNPQVANPGNRRIDLKHAQGFATYYLTQDNWIIPGLILRAPSIFTFAPNTELPAGFVDFGVMSYPKRKQVEIQILDGQHRILGFHLALEQISEKIEKAKDHRARALKVEGKGSRLVKDAEKDLADLEQTLDRFYRERVTVEIQIMEDVNAYRQAFFDIADNAKGISASVKARFDKRKVVNRALPIVTEHPLLVDRVDPENDRLGRTGPYLLSAKHVTEIIRVCNVGIDGRVGKVQERELSDAEVAGKATRFLDLLVSSFPQLDAVQQGTLTPDRLRQVSLLGSPLFLRILAGVHRELRDPIKHAWSEAEVGDYFTRLSQHVAAPVHANSIWITHTPADTFNIGSYGPNGRRQDIMGLWKALWEWAVDGAQFVADPPLPEPEPEPDVIDYSDLGDESLATRLKAEDKVLGIV